MRWLKSPRAALYPVSPTATTITFEHFDIGDLGPFPVVSGVRVGHLIHCYADTSKEMIVANMLMPRKGFAGAVITRYDFFANWMFWVYAGIGSNLTVRKKGSRCILSI